MTATGRPVYRHSRGDIILYYHAFCSQTLDHRFLFQHISVDEMKFLAQFHDILGSDTYLCESELQYPSSDEDFYDDSQYLLLPAGTTVVDAICDEKTTHNSDVIKVSYVLCTHLH